MANLGSFRIITDNEWVDFETATSLTFTDGTTYMMQTGDICALCIKATKPDDNELGFVIDFTQPFGYLHDDTLTLWIKTYDRQHADINVAE